MSGTFAVARPAHHEQASVRAATEVTTERQCALRCFYALLLLHARLFDVRSGKRRVCRSPSSRWMQRRGAPSRYSSTDHRANILTNWCTQTPSLVLTVDKP